MGKPGRSRFGGSNRTAGGPTSPRNLEASGGDLLAAALDPTAADPIAFLAVVGIIHALLVVGVIGDRTLSSLSGQGMLEVTLTGLDHLLGAAMPQPIFDFPLPTFSLILCGENRLSNGREILDSIIPIHNLDGIGEIMGDQLPNPGRPITEKNQFLGFVRQASYPGGP